MGIEIPVLKHKTDSLVSLGDFVLDEIRFPTRPPMNDLASGSATYASIGYRLFFERMHRSKVGFIIVAGGDFPLAVKNQLKSFGLDVHFVRRQNLASRRCYTVYAWDNVFGPRHYRWTGRTPLMAIEHLSQRPDLARSSTFHLRSSPQAVGLHIERLLQIRQGMGIKERPYIVWQPLHYTCIVQNRNAFLEACKQVNVFLPNRLQMAALFEETPGGDFKPDTLIEYARVFARHIGYPKGGAVVIRAAEYGSLTVTCAFKTRRLPAFYNALEPSPKCVDPTSGEETFIGGFIAGWHCTHDHEEASMWGIVAASFAFEQIGPPSLTRTGKKELWNNTRVLDRLEEYKNRLKRERL